MSYPRYHPRSDLQPLSALDEATFLSEFPFENQHVEFKRGVKTKDVCEAAVAFFNADGGVLFIGYDERHGFVDRAKPGEDIRCVYDAVSSLHNPGHVKCRELTVGTSRLVVVSFARRLEGFSQLGDGGVRERLGASNRKLIGSALSRFQLAHLFVDVETTVTPLPITSVPEDTLRSLTTMYGFDVEPALGFEREEFALRVDGEHRLTLAGALIALPDNHRVLGRTGIEFRRYDESENEPDKRLTITDTAAGVIARATELLRDELGYQSVLVGPRRHDLPRLPEIAVRETIANAIAHRSYEYRSTWTLVLLYRDRLVVESPGLLPEPMTLEHIRTYQAARNRILLKHLRRCGLAEDLGQGIARIEDGMAGELLRLPEYEETSASFRVTLYLNGIFTLEERGWMRELTGIRHIAPSDAPVVVLARRGGRLTNAVVRRELSCDRETAMNMLQRLRDTGVLDQSGRRGGVAYTLNDDLLASASRSLSDEETRLAILDLAEQGPITNADVRRRLDVSRPASLALLAALTAEGFLIREGKRRGTRYRLPRGT